jgi:hypothetical protein
MSFRTLVDTLDRDLDVLACPVLAQVHTAGVRYLDRLVHLGVLDDELCHATYLDGCNNKSATKGALSAMEKPLTFMAQEGT